MKKKPIIITWPDHARLTELVEEQNPTSLAPDARAFQQLRRELERAQLVAAKDIPADVVTMNSQVRVFDLEVGDQYIFTLAWPNQQNMSDDRINVLAPLGMALLGSRVGQEIEWPLPDGRSCQLRVEEVLYQPENSHQNENAGRSGWHESISS